MKRRSVLAGLLALIPGIARAQRDAFPLMPKPNPNVTCAEPLDRRVGIPAPPSLLSDLLLWQYRNPHVLTAYVVVSENQIMEVPVGSMALINGTTFTFTVMGRSALPDDARWMIMPDC
jgi:hypothetical protein